MHISPNFPSTSSNIDGAGARGWRFAMMSSVPAAGLALFMAMLGGCVSPGGGSGVGIIPASYSDVAVDTIAMEDGQTADGLQSGDSTGTDGATNNGQDGAKTQSDAGPKSDTTNDAGNTDAGCVGDDCCASASECDDANPCTDDACVAGKCSHKAVVDCTAKLAPCTNSAGCAKGVCDPSRNACVQCMKSADCGAGGYCKANRCQAAPACKSDTQCKTTNQVCATTEGACVDCKGDADCGDKMRCVDYACKPKVSCTSSKQCTQVCDTKAGVCVACLAHADCDKGSICHSASGTCIPAVCSGAACAGITYFGCKADGSGFETGASCADSNQCTDDACKSATGCQQTANTQACDDGNKCTTSDACSAKKCVSGKAKTCNDGNPCTTDSCKPSSGCTFTAHTKTCNDGDACTVSDSCSGGSCKGGKKKSCDDGKVCTDDGCKSASGCTYSNNSKACSDGDFCTTGDSCKAGKCTSGSPNTCDDKKLCTSDSCDKKTGKCVYVSNTVSCDDGDICTSGEACSGGSCKGGKKKDCDDGTTCSADACDAKKGCVHTPVGDGTICASGSCKGGLCMALSPALGDSFTCALRKGGVRCFGSNSSGRLGGGSTSSSMRVADVVGLSTATQVAAGVAHACARLSDGTVRCWGNGSYGQIGNGSTGYSAPKPMVVKGLADVAGVSMLRTTSCAWKTDGSAYCWGSGGKGERGDGSTSQKKSTPQLLKIKAKVTSIAGGSSHACAVTTTGELWCWGANTYGRIISGTEQFYLSPVQIKGLPTVKQAALGVYHTCALVAGGDVWCWGRNYQKQATGAAQSLTLVKKPTKVANVAKAIAIAAGLETTCALLGSGKVLCWGSNDYGQAGTGSAAGKTSVVKEVVGLSGVTALDVGVGHTCAFSGEKLMCWGRNNSGQLGLVAAKGPTQVAGITTAVDLALGSDYGCAVDKAGGGWCWGSGSYGKLGNGKSDRQAGPVKVATTVPLRAIRSGSYVSCGLAKDGSALCWGSGSYGVLGTGKSTGSTNTPQLVTVLSAIDDLQIGGYFACARSKSKAYCWGQNSYGQIGNNSTVSAYKATELTMLAGTPSIATGERHACGVTATGTVLCWGLNDKGQIGDDTKTTRKVPVVVKGLTDITAVYAGGKNSCARNKSGKLYCWGDNYDQQVGPKINNSSYTPYTKPREMTSYLKSVLGISVSPQALCVVLVDGAVRCQGRSTLGILLDGGVSNVRSYKPVNSVLSGVKKVALSYYISCAMKTDGTVWCAGRGDQGQRGDNSEWRYEPTLATVY